MCKLPVPPRLGTTLAAATVVWLGLVDGAAAQSPGVTVTVFADHYVLGDRAFDDLDALEAVVRAGEPRSIRLDACGTGTARAQQAAAHRFRATSLELRLLDAASTECRTAVVPRAVPATLRADARPTGIDDAAVERWWHAMMP